MSSIDIKVRVHTSYQDGVCKAIAKKLQAIDEIESFSIQYGIDTVTATVHAPVEALDSIVVEVHEQVALCNPLRVLKQLDVIDNGDNDQPTTCTKCGARTEFMQVSLRSQMHTCIDCGYVFVLSHP